MQVVRSGIYSMIAALAALFAAATPVEPAPPPEVNLAGERLASCMGEQLDQAEDNVRPEVIADGIVEHCRPQLDAAAAAQERWIASSTMSDRDKANARTASRRSFAGLRNNLVRQIRASRRRREAGRRTGPVFPRS
jgi:hypothetical protein